MAPHFWVRAVAVVAACSALSAPAAGRSAAATQRYLESISSVTDRVRVAEGGAGGGLGLVLLKNCRRGDVLLEVPLSACASAENTRATSAALARAEAAAGESWEPWCGDASLVALGLLERRDDWVASLPADAGLPLTDVAPPPVCGGRDFGALRENCDDDLAWLVDNGGLSDDDADPAAWRRALGWVVSRGADVGGAGLCVVPGADYCDHDDVLDPFDGRLLLEAASPLFGGNKKTVKVRAAAPGAAGDFVLASYGPAPAGEYLERYGFMPETGAARRFAATAEVRFELDGVDRFLDDKVRVLYEAGAIDAEEHDAAFVEACLGGEPDGDVLRFLRLSALGGADAFLLEPIFAAGLYDLLAEPLSRENEEAVVAAVDAEAAALAAEIAAPVADPRYEALRAVEVAALGATRAWAATEATALPAKQYYQERRLKDLGLDTDWTEGEGNSWTGSRAGGNVDW